MSAHQNMCARISSTILEPFVDGRCIVYVGVRASLKYPQIAEKSYIQGLYIAEGESNREIPYLAAYDWPAADLAGRVWESAEPQHTFSRPNNKDCISINPNGGTYIST